MADAGERKPRILVVEDDPAIRSGMSSALRSEGYDVRTEIDGSDIEGVIEVFRPNLAVLDVGLPVGPNGFELAQSLRRSTDLPIIFVTAAGDMTSRLTGFEAGGDDYVVKPFGMAELIARVRALLRRAGQLDVRVWEVADLVVDEDAHAVTRNGCALALTHIEYQLLSLFVRNEGKVLSKVRIISKVWGFDSADVNLVEKHVGALRKKLEAHGPRLLHTVRGTGYVLKA